MSVFKLSPQVDANKVFLVHKKDVDGRLDPLYYFSVNNLAIVNHTIYPIHKLSEVIEMTRGRFGHRPRNDPQFYGGQYPFIQTGDVVRASQSNGKITYSQTLNELGLKTSRLFDKPVVVLTIAANIGDTAILDYPSCFPDSLIGMRPKNDSLTLEYINLYFKFIRTYLNDLAPQAAQKNINYQQLAPIPIVIPPLAVQDKAVEIYQGALLKQEQKEQQATELLASIDGYLLGELGITLPQQENTLEKRMFRVSSREVSGGRLDPDYSKINYQLLEEAIKNSKCKTEFLKDISEKVHAGKTPASTDYSETKTDFPLIKVGSYSKDFVNLDKVDYAHGQQPHRIKKGDIFILSAAHQSEYVGRHIKYLNDEPLVPTSFVGELICVRVNQRCISMFLFSLLSMELFKTLINREKTGQTSHVYGKDLKWLAIPLPPIEKQKEIATRIQSIRTQAAQLQTEAAQLLAAAKAQVERMILGEG